MIKIIKKESENNRKGILHNILLYLFNNNFRVQCKIRKIVNTNNKLYRYYLTQKLEKKYAVSIGANVKIGRNCIVGHYNGIVIGEKTTIGNNCKLYQQVTIGQKNDQYPCIGNNVTIFPGAKIIGGISIGNNVIIAPNSVVINDVDDNMIVGGVPTKVLK